MWSQTVTTLQAIHRPNLWSILFSPAVEEIDARNITFRRNRTMNNIHAHKHSYETATTEKQTCLISQKDKGSDM